MLDDTTLLKTLAINCGSYRKARRLTFDELSKRSCVSKGMLVEIEQGRRNPSIATLCRMAQALGVTVSELVDPQSRRSRLVAHKATDGRVLWETKGGSQGTLIDTSRIGAVAAEIWRWRLIAKELLDGDAHAVGATEFLAVQRGTLTVTVAAESIVVRAGETARLSADVSHRYANAGASTCEFTMVVLEPIG